MGGTQSTAQSHTDSSLEDGRRSIRTRCKNFQTWKRALAKASSALPATSLSRDIINGVLSVFSDLPEEILTVQSYKTFEEYADRITLARERWVTATNYLTDKQNCFGQDCERISQGSRRGAIGISFAYEKGMAIGQAGALN